MAHPLNHDTIIRRQTFISCGLSDKEAVVYDTLLQLGTAYGGQLEKATGLKKNTYALLTTLTKKSMVQKIRRDNKDMFQAAPPDRLHQLLAAQKAALTTTEASLDTLLPALQSQYALSVGKPTIRYFEGEDGLRDVFSDIYAEKSEPVWGCVDIEIADKVFPEHILKDLIPLRVKNRLFAYSLLGDSAKTRQVQKEDAKHLRQSILMDKKEYPLPAEIDVYEDKIAMMSFEKGKFIGVIIQNKQFAESLKSIFKRIFSETGTTR